MLIFNTFRHDGIYLQLSKIRQIELEMYSINKLITIASKIGELSQKLVIKKTSESQLRHNLEAAHFRKTSGRYWNSSSRIFPWKKFYVTLRGDWRFHKIMESFIFVGNLFATNASFLTLLISSY